MEERIYYLKTLLAELEKKNKKKPKRQAMKKKRINGRERFLKLNIKLKKGKILIVQGLPESYEEWKRYLEHKWEKEDSI